MSTPSKSYTKLAYDLRPAKQVQRRMIIDALLRLMNAGVPIQEYQYTGLGSIYFVDFILLHKLLGLQRFICAEYDTDITERMKFNRPFGQVDIRMEPIGDVLLELDVDDKHLVWLDYDYRLNGSVLEDATLAAHHLSAGSMLLVTVDAEPPKDADRNRDRERYLREECEDYLPVDFDASWCTPENRPDTNLTILQRAIVSGMAFRRVEFIPIFRFIYADGHEMVTLGGMIGTEREERQVDSCDWSGAHYLRRSDTEESYRIRVPRLTSLERRFLDQRMPWDSGRRLEEFELAEADLDAYREIYRFLPLYGELLV